MSVAVADRGANKNELIVHAAEVIGHSKHRYLVFKEIYTGKIRIKTVRGLIKKTGLDHRRVLDAGLKLANADIIRQVKVAGGTAYEKMDFFQSHRDKILKAATDSGKRAEIPTKRGVSKTPVAINVAIKIPKVRDRAKSVTIDDIDTFAKVRPISHGLEYVEMSETAFKNGVARILGEKATFNDWGGELRDLSSTHMKIGGKRRMAAVAFKGPGKTGRLVPGKMGKNGNQIQRLALCPAEVFFVQYWRDIDDSVFEQLEKLVRLKSYFEGRELWYGIIDGDDSARLIQAYPKNFPGVKKRARKKR